jgi:hypothetical protein
MPSHLTVNGDAINTLETARPFYTHIAYTLIVCGCCSIRHIPYISIMLYTRVSQNDENR